MKAQLGQVVGEAISIMRAIGDDPISEHYGFACSPRWYVDRALERLGWTVEEMVVEAEAATSAYWVYKAGLGWLLDD